MRAERSRTPVEEPGAPAPAAVASGMGARPTARTLRAAGRPVPGAARSWTAGRPVLAVAVALIVGCGGSGGPIPAGPGPRPGGGAAPPSPRPAPHVHGEALYPPLREELDAEAREWVEETLASLTLEEAVGQLVIQWIDGAHLPTSGPEFEEVQRWVEEVGIGGLYLSIGTPHAYAAKVNELQRRARVPLLFASDFEDGGPGMRLAGSYALPSLLPQGGGTDFPPTMAVGATGDERLAREYGRVTGEEARAVGVLLNFAPVLDVNSDPGNPVIGTRAFGGDAELVARLGAAYVDGLRSAGVMATAKHFPGHGDTGVDSHLDLPSVDADRTRLDTLELVPFRRAVEAGVDAVMTAHVALPAILGERAPPATLSPEVMTGLLREEMGFGGLLVTDALTMGAITRGWGAPEAAVRALEAGADILLSPGDVERAVATVAAAVREGRLPEARVRRSAARVLEAKARVGLNRERLVDADRVDAVVGAAGHRALADTVARRSLVLVRDPRGEVPLPPGARRLVSVTFAPERDLLAGRAFDSELGPALASAAPSAIAGGGGGEAGAPTVRSHRLTPSSPPDAWAGASRALDEADAVVVGVYSSPAAGTGLDALPSTLRAFVRRASSFRPTVVVAFGSPWVLEALPRAPAFLVAWGAQEASQQAAARALAGGAALTGRLPVPVPPHPVGYGLIRPAAAATDPGAERPPEAGDPQAGDPPGAGDPSQAGGLAGPGRPRAGVPLPGAGGLPGPGRPPSSSSWATPTGFVVADAVEVDPREVGMDPAVLADLDSVVLAALADSAAPGAALAVGRHGRLVRLRGYGTPGRDEEVVPGPVTPTTLYDLASVTKVVGTTTAVMILVQEGLLDLDAPVVRYLPWWGGPHADKERVTVRQLLLHRGGLPSFRRWFLEMAGETAYREAIAAEPLEGEPGAATVYSDIGAMTLAFLVEEVSGRRLDVFLEERVWGPLDMDDTGFLPDPSLLDRIAPTELDTLWRGVHVHGVVHDENADALGGVAGHAGLFSTAWDLSVFARTMLAGGVVEPCVPAAGSGVPCTRPRADSARILDPETVESFTRRHDDLSSRALGWDTPSGRSSAGDYFTARAFGHTGFTGTSIWMDPELDLFVVLLTNRVNPTRDNSRHVPLRRAVHDLAARAITDRPVPPREGGPEDEGMRDPGAPEDDGAPTEGGMPAGGAR